MSLGLFLVLGILLFPVNAFAYDWYSSFWFQPIGGRVGFGGALVGRDMNGAGFNGIVLDRSGVVSMSVAGMTIDGKVPVLAEWSKTKRKGRSAKEKNFPDRDQLQLPNSFQASTWPAPSLMKP